MKQLNPYLTFAGNCREAMQFYRDCLGGEVDLQTVGSSPMAADMPAEAKDNILHSTLKISGKDVLMASDMMGPEKVEIGNSVTLCVVCESKEEIASLFAKLSVGGKVRNELKDEFFGTFGDLTDKFGMRWMLQFGEAPKQ